ncbi:hypothetical protein SAMN05216466_122118 [Paraburkholderia phenazinium]|uniref:Uncharacterized protein n=1 Tax=Paraburkholderia phenazinium TaxID=60549 RepID=A0A1G8KFI0_9BURK|nr:hypothetical protein SAMN05216466_122118 [Paraburkholderia phenazinium]
MCKRGCRRPCRGRWCIPLRRIRCRSAADRRFFAICRQKERTTVSCRFDSRNVMGIKSLEPFDVAMLESTPPIRVCGNGTSMPALRCRGKAGLPRNLEVLRTQRTRTASSRRVVRRPAPCQTYSSVPRLPRNISSRPSQDKGAAGYHLGTHRCVVPPVGRRARRVPGYGEGRLVPSKRILVGS